MYRVQVGNTHLSLPRLRLLLAFLLTATLLYAEASDLGVILARAQAEQSSGQYAAAASDYAQATSLRSDVAELWANRGLMEYFAGQKIEAIASFRHALVLKPGLLTPKLFLGKAYNDARQPRKALPFLKQAHATSRKDVTVLMALGDTYLSLNDPGRASVLYQEATSIDPSAANAWFGLGVSALASVESSGRALAEQHATSVWARALLADALFAQKRNSEGVDIYKEITIKATPDELLVFAATMNAMVRNPELFGVPENAVSKFHEILPQLSDLPCPTACVLPSKSYVASNYAGKERKQAACSFWQGNFDGAADVARRALRAQPDEPESLYWSVKANEHRAVAAFSRFEELAPRSAVTHDMLGDLYRRQFQTDKALREYDKALAINPGDPAALLGKAAGFFYDLNLAETIATAKLGLMDRPDDPQLNLLVAEALVREANYKEGKPYLQKSFSAPPELLARVHALQSKIYASEGNTARAIEELKMALPADEDGNIYYQLARLYRTEGRTEEAKKAEAECKILVKRRLERAEVAIRSSDTN